MSVEELRLTEQMITAAADSYFEALELPQGLNQALIVTDKADDSPERATNVDVRRQMAEKVRARFEGAGVPLRVLEFDHKTSLDDMQIAVTEALGELDGQGETTTVVYLGDAWANRTGLYRAASSYASDKPKGSVRLAGSLGFSSGDCRVMSMIGETQVEGLKKIDEYFADFMEAHPKGKFVVITTDASGQDHQLMVSFDTSKGPFRSEVGRFDDEHTGEVMGFRYVNIPGGERFGTPYPFEETSGSFVADGIVFEVANGLVVGYRESREGALETMTESSQALLLKLVGEGRGVPVSELGLGFYEMAGIKTFSDSSVLSREKGGPHIGMGHTAIASVQENEITELAGDFQHTDFVMEQARIVFIDPETSEEIDFYPKEVA